MNMQAELQSQPEPTTDTVILEFDPRKFSIDQFDLSLAEPTVLIVDDELLIRDLLVEVMQNRGFTVLEAADAEQASVILGNMNNRVDVLISDIRLPGMDGRELAKVARNLRPDLKVLFLSGYASAPREGYLDSSTEFMAKPFRINEVAEHVEALL